MDPASSVVMSVGVAVGWIVFCPGMPSSCSQMRTRAICRSLLVLQGISRSVVVALNMGEMKKTCTRGKGGGRKKEGKGRKEERKERRAEKERDGKRKRRKEEERDVDMIKKNHKVSQLHIIKPERRERERERQ